MHIDENLTWKQHIAAIKRKVSIVLFYIKQVKNVLPPDSSCFDSATSILRYYGMGNAEQNVIRLLTLVQKRAIRVNNNNNKSLFRILSPQ